MPVEWTDSQKSLKPLNCSPWPPLLQHNHIRTPTAREPAPPILRRCLLYDVQPAFSQLPCTPCTRMPANVFANTWALVCEHSQPTRRLTDLRLTGLRLLAPQLAWLELTTLRLATLCKQVWLKILAVLCRGLFLELQRHNYWSREPCV